ncbi:hypothetical protein BDZ97DRAFT_1781980 [Flammula alnicola]|nr:hypothetical protein BDZ97DRAFT_1781980 [Flammula alnicola]
MTDALLFTCSSISNDGRSTFFGQTANSWNEEGSEEEEESSMSTHDSPEPSDPAWLSYAFPFTSPISKTRESVRQAIMSKLPPMSTARVLSDLYFRHASWMYNPISEEDYNETIFRHIYEPEKSTEPLSAHNLSAFCTVLAIGSLLDLDRPAHSPEAMRFYHYGRAALSIDSVLEEQSITAIQALLLMCHFMFLSEISSPRWAVMGMIVKLAQSVNRDSGKWNLDPEQTRKRRELFYELLTYDSWQSLTFGRPPSLSPAHIDNQLPHETTKNEAGEVEMTFAAWKHRFAFGTRTPNYKVIQELDRKVRNWYVPPSLQVPGFGAAKLVSTEVEQPSVQLTMQRYIAFAIREMTLFYMHRGFFAQALEDSPTDPMGSKYSPSVLAAYGSATTFVGLIESLFNQHPQLTERMWFLFTHVFSCAIVLGSIAQKSQMGLARSALSHLDSAYNLFSRVSDHARAGKILPILAKLRERAHMALTNTSLPLQSETATRLSFYGPKIKSEVDELSALGGMTRLVARRSSSSPSPPQSSASPTIAEASSAYLPVPEGSSSTAWQTTRIYKISMPSHVQQQQHHSGMMMEVSSNQAYYANGYASGYGNVNGYPMTQVAPSPEMMTPPHDLQDTWQNFMAQYKQ